MLTGLSTINLELTTRCNKNCWMCGRRKIEKEHPEIAIKYADMNFSLIEKIAKELPDNVVVQFHNNGEGLLFERFGEAVSLFKKQIKCVTTNGKLLVEKANEIIDNLDTLSVSIIENDNETLQQLQILKQFLEIKKDKKPFVIARLVGNVDETEYKKLGLLIAKRALHSPFGSYNYMADVTLPEIGVCLDLLHHLAISYDGDVSLCVRFDPNKIGVLGNIKNKTLDEIWNGEKRKEWLKYHLIGQRDKVPLCSNCDFWGVANRGE